MGLQYYFAEPMTTSHQMQTRRLHLRDSQASNNDDRWIQTIIGLARRCPTSKWIKRIYGLFQFIREVIENNCQLIYSISFGTILKESSRFIGSKYMGFEAVSAPWMGPYYAHKRMGQRGFWDFLHEMLLQPKVWSFFFDSFSTWHFVSACTPAEKDNIYTGSVLRTFPLKWLKTWKHKHCPFLCHDHWEGVVCE